MGTRAQLRHATDSLRQMVSEELSLRFPCCDWAAANADPGRIAELLQVYFDGWKAAAPVVRQTALGDVILASLDCAMAGGTVTDDERTLAEHFVRTQRGDQAANLEHWVRRGTRPFVAWLAETVLTVAESADRRYSNPFAAGDRPLMALEWQRFAAQFAAGSSFEAHSPGFAHAFYLHRLFGLRGQPDPYDQDFGVMYADAARVEEFLRFYLTRRERYRLSVGMLEELIFASLDEALMRGPRVSAATLSLAHEFVGVCASSGSLTLDYWRRWSGPAGLLTRALMERQPA